MHRDLNITNRTTVRGLLFPQAKRSFTKAYKQTSMQSGCVMARVSTAWWSGPNGTGFESYMSGLTEKRTPGVSLEYEMQRMPKRISDSSDRLALSSRGHRHNNNFSRHPHTPTHQNVIAAIALIVALNPACQAKEYFVVERSQSYPFDERLIDLHGPTHPVIM